MIAELNSFIDSQVSDYQTVVRMLEIQRKLTGVNPPKIIVAGRKLLKEGMLNVLNSKSKRQSKSQQRMLYLFSDVLLIAAPKPRGFFECVSMLPLCHCEVRPVLGRNLIRLNCKSESLLLLSKSWAEIDEWKDAVISAVWYVMGFTSCKIYLKIFLFNPKNPKFRLIFRFHFFEFLH